MPHGHPSERRPVTKRLCAGLTVLLALSIVCGVSLGPVSVPFSDVMRLLKAAFTGDVIAAAEAGAYRIVWDIRLPRVLLAAVVGAGLSVVGVAIQAMVRNALADPYVLGISSGASVGATAVATTGLFAALGIYALSTAAFLSALAAMALVYLAARRGGLTPLRLVLTGTAMAYGFSAIAMLLVFQAPRGEAARAAMFWLLGSLGGVTWMSLPIAATVVLAGITYLRVQAKNLNAMSMGDETATTLGVDITRLRKVLFVVTAAMTGVLVAVSGAIGFVGLMLPHLVRLVVGADHRKVLAVAPLAGACFLIWVDVAARLLAAPEELPLGVITAALGVPCFVFLMRGRGYVFGGK
ncbi:ABC-type iron transporter, permease subunit [Saccharothrix espanaensis DSM 44229]|uniref:ABC-type iron transporter, permease subunit n=1 Tax=Saccharothrix espanaensis (strain ATCC 51144 / DSM 44229 / JCM 9112 / NBRC 15066 / NRRL 15764) TaxID=1179773 RepID=K0KCA7_SACES|nr:ABC-type iron transporter, permease subunit [Saccharothrix espanaensis DSM 44229]